MNDEDRIGKCPICKKPRSLNWEKTTARQFVRNVLAPFTPVDELEDKYFIESDELLF